MKTLNYRSLNGLFDFKLGIDSLEEGFRCLLLNAPEYCREAVNDHPRLQEMYGVGIPILTSTAGEVFPDEKALLSESAHLIEELINETDNEEAGNEDTETSTSITLEA